MFDSNLPTTAVGLWCLGVERVSPQYTGIREVINRVLNPSFFFTLTRKGLWKYLEVNLRCLFLTLGLSKCRKTIRGGLVPVSIYSVSKEARGYRWTRITILVWALCVI